MKLSDITADMVREVSALMPVRYLFWTPEGLVSIGPGHPQYE